MTTELPFQMAASTQRMHDGIRRFDIEDRTSNATDIPYLTMKGFGSKRVLHDHKVFSSISLE